MGILRYIFVIGFLAISGANAVAQTSIPALDNSFLEDRSISSAIAYNLDPKIAPIGRIESVYTGWELSGGNKDKKITLKLAPRSSAYGFSIALSAPLEDGQDSVTLIDSKTDVFVNSTSLSVGFRGKTFLSDEEARVRMAQEVFQYCIENYEPDLVFPAGADDTQKQKLKEDTINKFCTSKPLDLVTAKDLGRGKEEAFGKIIDSYLSVRNTTMLLYGMNATVARKEFDYFTGIGIESKEESERPWGASWYLSYVKTDTFAVTIVLEYQKGFESGSKVTRCLNNSEDTFLNCKAKFASTPVEDINKNLKLGVRYLAELKEVVGFDVGISPEYVIDTEDDEESYSFPIYLFADANTGFGGGIKYEKRGAGNASGMEEIIGIFLGGKFSLF